MISRRSFNAALAGACILWPLAGARADAIKSSPNLTVIELFTSEGCYSCPPAEAVLKEIADEPHILALAYHVDYWDYIGWKDPFADPEFTKRQRQYATYFSSRTVYTPQMVFQGSSHAPGSRPGEAAREIRRVSRLERVDVGLRHAGENRLEVSLPASDGAPHSRLLLVMFDHEQTTDVPRGENAGKTLTHRNVVRRMLKLGKWRGEAKTMTVDIPPERTSERMGCAILVQSENSGRIVGAGALSLDS